MVHRQGARARRVRVTEGPWRVTLLYKGKLTLPVVKLAWQGRVHLIDARFCPSHTSLAIALTRRAVPVLICKGCSLIELDVSGVRLNGTWASAFGEVAEGSAVLRSGCASSGGETRPTDVGSPCSPTDEPRAWWIVASSA